MYLNFFSSKAGTNQQHPNTQDESKVSMARVTNWVSYIRKQQTETRQEQKQERATMRNDRNVEQKLSAECAVQLTE